MTPPATNSQPGQSGQNIPTGTNTTAPAPSETFAPPAAEPVSTSTIPAEMQQQQYQQQATSTISENQAPQTSEGTPSAILPSEPITNGYAQTQQPTPVIPESPTPQGSIASPPPPEAAKKRFPLLKVVLLVLILLFLIIIIASLVFLSRFLKENYVPGVSGYTEKLLLSEGEQFALRNESLYKSFIYSSLTTEDSALSFKSDIDPSTIKPFMGDQISEELNNIKKLDYDSTFSIEYRLEKSIKETYESFRYGSTGNPNFVLGAVDPGEVNEQTINDILNSSTGKLNINSRSSIDFSDKENQKNQSTTELVFNANNVNLNTQFELKLLEDNLYFYLDRFPRNEYFKPELIAGKWISAEGDEYSSARLSMVPYNPAVLTNSELEFNQKEYEIFLNLLNSDAVKNTITSSYDERVGEYNARCYVMNLTAQNIDNIYRESARLYGTAYDRAISEQLLNGDVDLEKFELHLCYSKSSNIPVKVHVPLVISIPDIGTLELVSDLRVLSINSTAQISAPTDSTNFEDIDWSEVFMSLHPTTPPVPTNRTSLPSTINGLYNKGNICSLLPGSVTCTSCTNNSSDCESCLYYLNDESLREDPYVDMLCIDGIDSL